MGSILNSIVRQSSKFRSPVDFIIPYGCLDAYEVKVNKDTSKYQAKVK